ncbi:hypothetical protein C8F01DRAFT_1245898 [Mycena amicta]|nr:hypothetical protein C8F01DRAFT_1245898 [Mycena amicta]
MSPSTNVSTVLPAAATPDKVAADKDARLVASVPGSPSLKDQRAYEHDRQRVMKAADLVKMRARKGQRGWAALAKGELYISSRKNAFQPGSEKTKLLLPEDLVLEDEIAYDAAKVASLGGVAPTSAQPVEVKLGDLVTTVRKPRKNTISDFVVIRPHSVIPLDDITLHDLIIDEPWEHIYGIDDDESPATKALSYADILTMNSK